MAQWQVTDVIDGDTFTVSPPWEWEGQHGERVRPVGFDTPETGTPGAEQATAKLAQLLMGQTVKLTNCVTVDHDRLVCTVLFDDGKDLADYFSEYQT